ncbi:LPS-assembly protein [Rhizobiales bacterium GAS188]|nr:LPS-assembly protein [Rhizobiales bacterium GAS188]
MSIRIGESRIGPRVGTVGARGGCLPLIRLACVLLAVTLGCALPAPAGAQTQAERNAQKAAVKQSTGQSDMLVEANEMVYDKDKNSVAAVGNAKIYYQGKVLQADKVTYFRDKKQVLAEGNAKLTDDQGNVYYGSTFELTDDFKDGFINSLLMETKDKTRFSGPRAERAKGETTTFENGTYTACEPCKEDPTRPPLWQVRAKRIIDNHTEHKIYYEDAWLEFYGWPVFYSPYFSAPDPTVRRASGVLAPHFYGGTNTGYGIGVPYFWALAPNYDVTITPNYMTQQGFLGDIEWRHRLETGAYSVRVNGIDQIDPKAFGAPPYGANNKKFRGSFESTGKFYFNENWKYGWDISAATDKFYFHDYKIRSPDITYIDFGNFREAISQVYLNGKGERSWFDLRGFYFESLNGVDFQKQIPVAAPVFDYDRRFDAPSFLGGEVTVNANMENIHRQAGDFVDTAFRGIPIDPLHPGVVNPNYLNTFYFNSLNLPGSTYGNVYDACAVYSKATCIVRGMPGNYTRASVDLSWRRRFIDDFGQVWTPFAYLKGQASYTDVNTSGYNNIQIANFISPNQDFGTRVMPAIGLQYRFPLVISSPWGTSVLEPIAEIIARPSESRIGHLPNEDAQSLVFDDTNLFQWDKFSGYDRMEGGTRANAGLQYTFTSKSGAFFNMLFGESYALAGSNSFKVGDLTNTGLDAGLSTRRSDFVGRMQFQPVGWFSTTVRGRFRDTDFASERLEVMQSLSPFQALGWFSGTKQLQSIGLSGTYAHLAAQPALGQPFRRDALNLNASFSPWTDWTVSYGVSFDLTNHLQPNLVYLNNIPYLHYSHGLFEPASNSLVAQYKNDCCTFKAQYIQGYATSSYGSRVKDETVLFTLELRTLGAFSYSSDVTSLYNSVDGVNTGK